MPSSQSSALIVGASRGLGLAMAEEFLRRDWRVTATVRDAAHTGLHALAEQSGGRLDIEALDITEPREIAALRQRLDGRRFDLLFVNAGISDGAEDAIADIATAVFVRLMVTNTLSPLRVLEALQDVVPGDGTIGVMSSGLGSLGENQSGDWGAYAASKAALNMLMLGFAARRSGRGATLIIAPGWVRTDMGGAAAPLGISDSIPGVVDVLTSHAGKPGLKYLDYRGRTVAW